MTPATPRQLRQLAAIARRERLAYLIRKHGSLDAARRSLELDARLALLRMHTTDVRPATQTVRSPAGGGPDSPSDPRSIRRTYPGSFIAGIR